MVIVAKSMQTRGNLLISISPRPAQHSSASKAKTHIKRQIAPALLLVAFLRICKSGPAEELITPLMSPETKSNTIRKIVPVTVPIATQPIMILGPSTEGLGISMPVRNYGFLLIAGKGWNYYLRSCGRRRPVSC